MRQKNNQQMNNSKAIAKLLSGCVESLRISEVWAAEAAQELKLQKEFEDLAEDLASLDVHQEWLKISRSNFLRASEEAARWRQRAEIEWLEARKMGYDGPFDARSMRPAPSRWLQ